jgi:hypothetical protein
MLPPLDADRRSAVKIIIARREALRLRRASGRHAQVHYRASRTSDNVVATTIVTAVKELRRRLKARYRNQ